MKVFVPRFRRRQGSEAIEDLYVPDEAGLIGLLLPRKLRRFWNALVLGVVVLLLGTPHHLVLWNFYRGGETTFWLYFHYLWTLGYWLVLLALPVSVIASDRVRRETVPDDSQRTAPQMDIPLRITVIVFFGFCAVLIAGLLVIRVSQR